MGLFGFGKKKPQKDAPAQSAPGPEETARRWQEAYRANPRFYQRQDGGEPLGSCTLTEGADTLLPLHPETQWGIDGKPVPTWILTVVSLTENRVLSQTNYQEALARLLPDSLAKSEDWILIRALTCEELKKRFPEGPNS